MARQGEIIYKCSKCGFEGSVKYFYTYKRGDKTVIRSECMVCTKVSNTIRYRDADKETKSKRTERKRRRVMDNRAVVKAYLGVHPCVTCGESDIDILEFDHVRGRKFKAVGKLVGDGYALEVIFKEIKKCEVRCANCHKKRHVVKRRKARGKKEKAEAKTY